MIFYLISGVWAILLFVRIRLSDFRAIGQNTKFCIFHYGRFCCFVLIIPCAARSNLAPRN